MCRAMKYGLVCALALAGCEGADRQANQQPTQTTDAPVARGGESELGHTLEWLLSPTSVCSASTHVRPFPGEEPFGPMLELLGLAPIPPESCLEGVPTP
jgi:hypothetical protein